MPKITKIDVEKLKHPKSRKTIALSKHLKRVEHRKKVKAGHYVKLNLIGEKMLWFRDNLPSEVSVCSSDQIQELIETYLSRFDEELEQISIKHSIGVRKNRQHANREDVIKMTKERELEEYTTCGFEIPDLLNGKNVDVLRKWNGELRFLQNIKFRRFSKNYLIQLKNKGANSSNKSLNNQEKNPEVSVETKNSSEEKTVRNMDVDE